jgi:hypothetical protein
MNSRPRATSTTPAICWSSRRWSCSAEPKLVAVMPSATNMTVNERQNRIAGPRTFDRPSPAWISANETPEMVDR